jgi:hypothetical protein
VASLVSYTGTSLSKLAVVFNIPPLGEYAYLSNLAVNLVVIVLSPTSGSEVITKEF